jgi:hypothetical protein
MILSEDQALQKRPPSVIQVFPGISAIKRPDRYVRNIRWRHHSRVNGDSAAVVFVDTLVVRQAPAAIAVKELE